MMKISDTIERKFVDSIDLDNEWLIETDTGYEPVSFIHKTIEYTEWVVETANTKLVCADTHILFDGDYNEVFVQDLIAHSSCIITKYGTELVTRVEKTSTSSNMFDLTVESPNQRFYSNDILSHNTTTTVGYLLWLSLFNENYNIAITANKRQLAVDILSRYQLAYENLPMWIQQGVDEWNKGSLKLENGSKIIAASTSASSVRGGSFNCVSGDTKVTVKDYQDNVQLLPIQNVDSSKHCSVLTHKGFRKFSGVLSTLEENTKKINIRFSNNYDIKCTVDHRFMLLDGTFVSADNLNNTHILYNNIQILDKTYFTSSEFVYDLINVEETHSYQTNSIESHNCVVMDEFAHVHNNLAEEFFTSTYPVISSGKSTKIIIVSTPRGMNLFYKMWTDAVNKKSDYFPVDIHWSRVPGRDEAWKEKTIRNTSPRQFNQEFGCEFLGSTNTLVDGAKLQCLAASDPFDEEVHGMEIFEKPIKESFDDETKQQIDKDHLYVICADVSEGKNMDYTAFSVFDCSTIPYKQVATYRNNQLHPILFPDILKMCANYYNNAYVLIEINNNPTIADTLFQDLEYENVFKIYSGNRKAQVLSENGRATQNGLNMSPVVKRLGCSTLKTLIEMDKLQVNSSETIYELSRFIASSNSFSAEEGANDDLVMTLVMFAWLTTQKLFIELSSTDIRKRLQIENNYAKESDVDMPPSLIFSNTHVDEYIESVFGSKNYTVDDGDLWFPS